MDYSICVVTFYVVNKKKKKSEVYYDYVENLDYSHIERRPIVRPHIFLDSEGIINQSIKIWCIKMNKQQSR